MRRFSWLTSLVLACTSTTSGDNSGADAEPEAKPPVAPVDTAKPTKPDTKPDAAKPEPPAAPPEPAIGSSAPYYFVTLGNASSHTSKPVPNFVLAETWGWSPTTDVDKPVDATTLVRALNIRLGASVFVEPEQIAGWKVPTPPPELWLIGSTSACKATRGRPMLGVYSVDADSDSEADAEGSTTYDLSDNFTILELTWELTGCEVSDPGAWAPIGLPATRDAAKLRWQGAQLGARERIADIATWTGPLAAELGGLLAAAKSNEDEFYEFPEDHAPDWWTQDASIPGTAIGERSFTAVWRDEDDTPTPGKPDEYACGAIEYGVVIQTQTNATTTKALARHRVGTLHGALVEAGRVEHLVWTDSLFYHVAAFGRTLAEPVVVSTGAYHPESGGTDPYAVVRYCGP